jgi:hypothetical protein
MPDRDAKVQDAREEQLEHIERLERGETLLRSSDSVTKAAASATAGSGKKK